MQKIALVTGGSRGLGREMALTLASRGIDLVLTYHTKKEEADGTRRAIEDLGQKAVVLQVDMKSPSHREAFVGELNKVLLKQWGDNKIDFLVNNAGMGATVPFDQVTEEIFDAFLEVHFKGVYFLTQACLPMIREGGAIINISTGTTRFCIPGYSVYASMKGAVEVFTRYLAKELGNRQIRANVVAPGPVETDFNQAAIRNNPQLKTYLGSLSPLGRVGYPEDIAGVVAFLCSDDAKWINGQRIEVSGGINI